MTSSAARRWLAAVLLTAVVVPEALPLGTTGHRCAHGMAVECCCLRRVAMKAGDHCSLKGKASACSLQPAGDQAAEILPVKDLAHRLGIALRDGLLLPLSASSTLAVLGESPPDLPRPAPPIPPPRSAQAV